MAERGIEDPILRQRYSFRRSVDEHGSEVLHLDTWIDPGGRVTPHVHPAMEERFHVLAGHPSFLAGRTWRTAGPGEEVVVPAGVRHAYRNAGTEVAHVRCDVRPPSTLQEFLEDVAALSRAGGLSRRALLPKSPSALLQAVVIAHHYREMVVLLPPQLPPPFLQRLLFPPLARLGKRRGHRAGRFAAA
jgi:quercetin dioxygenase-like cupin family protein